MARLPRLAVAGHPHLVLQRGHNGQAVFLDDEDRQAYLDALREAARTHQVAVLAYSLADDHLHLLLTPPTDNALSRVMQSVGRRYVAGFNRRHGRSGTLWDGRFRAAPVDPGGMLLPALLFVDGHAQRTGKVQDAADFPFSSAGHHLGRRRDPLLSDAPAYWQLGNTPFERESRYAALLAEGLPAAQLARIVQAGQGGWALGDAAYQAALSQTLTRPVAVRARGRPRKLSPIK
ncbi:transposase [Burkholderiales bacterium JOSHI_001]|nr:transposase [Burkholderiales bacterium JOSHI_001]